MNTIVQNQCREVAHQLLKLRWREEAMSHLNITTTEWTRTEIESLMDRRDISDWREFAGASKSTCSLRLSVPAFAPRYIGEYECVQTWLVWTGKGMSSRATHVTHCERHVQSSREASCFERAKPR